MGFSGRRGTARTTGTGHDRSARTGRWSGNPRPYAPRTQHTRRAPPEPPSVLPRAAPVRGRERPTLATRGRVHFRHGHGPRPPRDRRVRRTSGAAGHRLGPRGGTGIHAPRHAGAAAAHRLPRTGDLPAAAGGRGTAGRPVSGHGATRTPTPSTSQSAPSTRHQPPARRQPDGRRAGGRRRLVREPAQRDGVVRAAAPDG